MSEWFQSILNKFKSAPAAPPYEPPLFPPNTPYPNTPEDLDLARRAGFGYETGTDQIYKTGIHTPVRTTTQGMSPQDFMNKKVVPGLENKRSIGTDGRVANAQLAAGLAANRSGITGLGYDPRRFAIDPSPGRSTYGGLYFPRKDAGWAEVDSPEALTHEAAHRGLKQLRDRDVSDASMSRDDEEYLVRYLMFSRMGDAEEVLHPQGAHPERSEAVMQYSRYPEGNKYQDRYENLENEARRAVAERRPRGMR